MQRWTSKDSIGRAMTAISKPEWKAVDDKTFTLALQEPFGMVLEGMAKPSGFPPVVMPERIAKLPTTAPLTEVMGSGPFMFKRDEWVPGNKVVFVRNPHYVARSDAPSGAAGSKKPHFDRVEWFYIPDSNSAAAALKKGEVDYIEQVPPDYINPLRVRPEHQARALGLVAGLDGHEPAASAVSTTEDPPGGAEGREPGQVHGGDGLPKDLRVTQCATFFICGSPNETFAGAEPWRTPDVAKAKQMLADAGYKGEKVVLLVPSDITYLNAEALMAAQTLKSIGMNVDMQTSDWATIGGRRAKKDAPDAGGWNMYVTVAGSFDSDSPITNAYLSASCGTPLPGWPCNKELDDLRTAWLKEGNPAKRKELLDKFHAQAFEALPYISAGQYSPVGALRKEIKGAENLRSGLPFIWYLDK
jgi:peptide/nickel transport system substrate-binding protein